jgi:hypothetical protein
METGALKSCYAFCAGTGRSLAQFGEDLQSLKTALGSYRYAGQYQQRPSLPQ